jgi:hypothetical protein
MPDLPTPERKLRVFTRRCGTPRAGMGALQAGLIALFGRGREIPARWDGGRDGGRANSPLSTAGCAEPAVAWAAHHIAEGRAYLLSADRVSCWKMRRGLLVGLRDALRDGWRSQRDQCDGQWN